MAEQRVGSRGRSMPRQTAKRLEGDANLSGCRREKLGKTSGILAVGAEVPSGSATPESLMLTPQNTYKDPPFLVTYIDALLTRNVDAQSILPRCHKGI